MANSENELLMTAEGFAALKTELEELKTVKRKEVSQKIRTARGFGDLSENSEYDEAKNEQALLEARIQQLEDRLRSAKVIESGAISTDVVSTGTRVKILDVEFDEVSEYRVVSSIESNQSEATITDESPIGRALLGHRAGETVEVEAPIGIVSIKIIEISL